jgi:hypothetical protein
VWRVALLLLVACGRVDFDDVKRDAKAIDAVPPGFCQTATFSNPAASALQDDFTTLYTDRWRPNPTGCMSQNGTELVATPTNPAGEYCFATTLGDVHLTCDSIFVRVPETTNPILRVQTFIYVTTIPEGQTFNVLLESGGFQMGASGGAPRDNAPFDPALDLWWRFSERDGEVTFSASQDGVAWRELMHAPTTISLDHVGISLGAGTYVTVPQMPGQARFRCYNEPPPCN